MAEERLGIDIGGSGVKYALVDVETGVLTSERTRVKTPQPATPDAITDVLAEIVRSMEVPDAIGVGFPAVVWDGEVFTANNIDAGWIGQNARDRISEAMGHKVILVNDADAAGMAEAAFGAAKGVAGLVLVITFGTGIGSGAIFDGELVPNFELGVLELEGHRPAEAYFSAKVRKRENLDWEAWADRVNRFLIHVNAVLNPQLMVFGGGVTKHWETFSSHLDEDLPVVPAAMGNNAGLIGAAVAAGRVG